MAANYSPSVTAGTVNFMFFYVRCTVRNQMTKEV